MSKKALQIILVCCSGLIVAGLLLFTVWGQTIKAFQANQFFKARNYEKAESIYEDLSVDLPASPVISHNLALCYYQAGLFERSITNFTKCLPKGNSTAVESIAKIKNAGFYYYHLGNALYKAASRNDTEPETAVKLYTSAVKNYKKALLANPADHASKYNYELAVLHLQQLANQPQTEQNPEQETEDLLQNTQNSEQYKAKLIQENNPPGGKDW
jgi:tetratricopeptide (TPR) repeat protein